MEQQTLKITNVLSDPTRFSIYQHVSRKHKAVTVQDIAEAFGIHSNVARLHLSKLEDVDLLESETKKSGKGGRPSRFYKVTDEVVSIQFPHRDYQRLADMALESLLSFGEKGRTVLQRIGKRYGEEAVVNYIKRHHLYPDKMTVEQKRDLIREIAASQGLNPTVEYDDTDHTIHFQIHNCPFKELLQDHSIPLCSMHHSMIKAMFQTVFDGVSFKEKHLMAKSDKDACAYEIQPVM